MHLPGLRHRTNTFPATLSFHQLATCSDVLGLLCRTRQRTATFQLASYMALTQPRLGMLTPNTSQVLDLIVKDLRSDDTTRPNWNVPVSCGRVVTEHGLGQGLPCALGRCRHQAGLEDAPQPRAGHWAWGDVLAGRAMLGGLLRKASLLCMWAAGVTERPVPQEQRKREECRQLNKRLRGRILA